MPETQTPVQQSLPMSYSKKQTQTEPGMIPKPSTEPTPRQQSLPELLPEQTQVNVQAVYATAVDATAVGGVAANSPNIVERPQRCKSASRTSMAELLSW